MNIFTRVLSFFILLFFLSQAVIATESQSPKDYFSLVEFTKEDIEKLDEIFQEGKNKNIKAVEKLLIDYEDTVDKLISAFIWANKGDFTLIKQYADLGGDVNVIPLRPHLMPFIYYAVEKNNLEMVNFLIQNGANVNYFYQIGNDVCTPLLLATRVLLFSQSFDVIDLLRSKGAKFPHELNY